MENEAVGVSRDCIFARFNR